MKQQLEAIRAAAVAAMETILGMSATATGLPEGSSPTVNYLEGVMAFGIPKGDRGLQGIRGPIGETPDIEIGTVTTLPAGANATAEIIGTPEEPILNLGIPRGNTGANAVVIEVGAVEYSFHVNGAGHLILSYGGEEAPDFEINNEGHLIYTF